MNAIRSTRLLLAVAACLSLAACAGYVKREEFDAAIADLQRVDEALMLQQVSVETELRMILARHEAAIHRMQGRLAVEVVIHFDFDDATLHRRDHALLDDFARVVREHRRHALVTVEGFADPAGTVAYNRALGMRRAEAVAGYLVRQGGLAPARVRAVSYGESPDRLVVPGAWGPGGEPNRRVVLVIDHLGG